MFWEQSENHTLTIPEYSGKQKLFAGTSLERDYTTGDVIAHMLLFHNSGDLMEFTSTFS